VEQFWLIAQWLSNAEIAVRLVVTGRP